MDVVELGKVRGELIRCCVVYPSQPVKSWLFVIHGLGEYAAMYPPYLASLPKQGIALVCLDLQGHGNSGGEVGDVRRFKDFLLAVKLGIQWAQKEFGGKGGLLGHSLGGVIALSFLHRFRPSSIKVTFVLSPWLQLTSKLPKWKSFFGLVVSWIFPRFKVKRKIGESIPREELSSGNLGHDVISVRLYSLVVNQAERLQTLVRRFVVPVVFFHGKKDALTRCAATKQFAQDIETPAVFHELDTAMHELLLSPYRSEIIARILHELQP